MFFLLLVLTVQLGKLFHAHQHHNSIFCSEDQDKHHGPQFVSPPCAACEFEYCKDALPETTINIQEPTVFIVDIPTPKPVSAKFHFCITADWRGPPSASFSPVFA